LPFKHISGARSISKEIGTDKRVNSLGSFIEITAHFRTLLNMDNLGRIEADPHLLRAMIFPMNPSVSVKKVSQICEAMHSAGLFFLYEANGELYMQSPRYERQKMVGHMKRASGLPPPDAQEFCEWLINIRKDSRYINNGADTCLKHVNAMLTPCNEHVTPEIELEEEGEIELESEEELEEEGTAAPSAGGPSQINIYNLYDGEIGKLTQAITEILKDAEEEYTAEWVADAIKEAVFYNKRSWKYIEAILERWQKEGRGAGKPHRQAKREKERLKNPALAKCQKCGQICNHCVCEDGPTLGSEEMEHYIQVYGHPPTGIKGRGASK